MFRWSLVHFMAKWRITKVTMMKSEFKLKQPVNISLYPNFKTGKIFEIRSNMSGGPAYVVEIDCSPPFLYEFGTNRVLIDTYKLSEV